MFSCSLMSLSPIDSIKPMTAIQSREKHISLQFHLFRSTGLNGSWFLEFGSGGAFSLCGHRVDDQPSLKMAKGRPMPSFTHALPLAPPPPRCMSCSAPWAPGSAQLPCHCPAAALHLRHKHNLCWQGRAFYSGTDPQIKPHSEKEPSGANSPFEGVQGLGVFVDFSLRNALSQKVAFTSVWY